MPRHANTHSNAYFRFPAVERDKEPLGPYIQDYTFEVPSCHTSCHRHSRTFVLHAAATAHADSCCVCVCAHSVSVHTLVVSVSVHTRCALLPPLASDCSRCMVANGVCLPLGIVCRICKKFLMCHGCIGEETHSSSSVRTVTSRTFQRIIGVSARVEIASVAPLGQRGCSINNCARRLSKCSAPDASRGVREPDARLCLHACECTQGAHVSELWFGRGQLPFDMLRMCGAAPILHRLIQGNRRLWL